MRRLAPGALALVTLMLVGLAPAEAQRRRRPRNREAAVAQRVAELVTAARLTEDQARSVFAQIRQPPLSPLVRNVVDERRPDGTRNVFGLLEVDDGLECRLDGGTPADCRNRRGAAVHVFFTQVAPDGRIARTSFATPFAIMTGARQRHLPTSLRLFAPSAGAAKVALVDGFSASAGRSPSYDHHAWIWDGRRERSVIVSQVGDANDAGLAQVLGAVIVDETGSRLVASEVSCRADCRCATPSSIERETAILANLARQGPACAPRERAVQLPAGFHLVDDDLAAVTPREPPAERWPGLARGAGLTEQQAREIVRALRSRGYPLVPRYGRFATHTGPDRTRHVWALLGESPVEECALQLTQQNRSVYDAVRACANETGVQSHVLYVQIGADGGVQAPTLSAVGHRKQVGELWLVRAGDTVVAAVEAWGATPNASARSTFYSHDVYFQPGGGITSVGAASEPHDFRERYVGEVVARPAGGGLSTLVQRRAMCSPECPCAPFPSDAAGERAILAGRASAANAQCRPQPERPIAPR